MVKIKCKCRKCNKIFQIQTMKVQQKYCKECLKQQNTKTAREFNKKLRPIWYEHKTYSNGREIISVEYIIDDISDVFNICGNCRADLKIRGNIEYDKIHGEARCKQCGLIIGEMEVYDIFSRSNRRIQPRND
jgi:hypothetical protein